MNRNLTSVDENYSPEPEEDVDRYGNGGNGGSGMGRRLTALENRAHAIENRLTAVEVHMQYLATKEDVERVKNSISKTIWIVAGVIVSIVLAIIKLVYH